MSNALVWSTINIFSDWIEYFLLVTAPIVSTMFISCRGFPRRRRNGWRRSFSQQGLLMHPDGHRCRSPPAIQSYLCESARCKQEIRWSGHAVLWSLQHNLCWREYRLVWNKWQSILTETHNRDPSINPFCLVHYHAGKSRGFTGAARQGGHLRSVG